MVVMNNAMGGGAMKGNNSNSIRVLVVCLGNICRSPIGEAVLNDVAQKRGIPIQVDSCGTSNYNVGKQPDERSIWVCKKYDVPIKGVARRIQISDFDQFSHILAADNSNLRSLLSLKPLNCTAEVRLWGSYLDDAPIPDPYYGDADGFEEVFQQCVQLSNAFLDDVTQNKQIDGDE